MTRHADLYRWRNGRKERRCAMCREWLEAAREFYIDSSDGQPRSDCKQCFMAKIIQRKRAQRSPFRALETAWGKICSA